MDVFEFRGNLVKEYADFTRSFTRIKADDIRTFVDAEYDSQKFWPEPLIQVNPNFKEGGSTHELNEGVDVLLSNSRNAGHRLGAPLRDESVQRALES